MIGPDGMIGPPAPGPETTVAGTTMGAPATGAVVGSCQCVVFVRWST